MWLSIHLGTQPGSSVLANGGFFVEHLPRSSRIQPPAIHTFQSRSWVGRGSLVVVSPPYIPQATRSCLTTAIFSLEFLPWPSPLEHFSDIILDIVGLSCLKIILCTSAVWIQLMSDSRMINAPEMEILLSKLPVVAAGRCPQTFAISPRVGSPQGYGTGHSSLTGTPPSILHRQGSGILTGSQRTCPIDRTGEFRI